MGSTGSASTPDLKGNRLRQSLITVLIAVAIVGCRTPFATDSSGLDALVVSERPSAADKADFGEYTNSRLRSQVRPRNPQPTSKRISDHSADEPSESQFEFESALVERQKAAAAAYVPQNSSEQSQKYSVRRQNSAQKRPVEHSSPTSEAAEFSLSDDEESSEPNEVMVEVPSYAQNAPHAQPDPKPVVVATSRAKDSDGRSGDRAQADVQTHANATPKKMEEVSEPQSKFIVEPAIVTAAVDNQKTSSDNAVATASASVSKSEKNAESTNTWRTHLNQAIASLKVELDNNTSADPLSKLNAEASHKLMSLIQGDLDTALTPIEGLQPHEQEFVRHQLQGLHDAFDPAGNPVAARRWTLALQSLRKAQSHLAALSNLEVKNVALCTEVDSYGIVTKFPEYKFRADQKLLLYCELDNFTSEAVKNGFETQLQGNYELLDSNGRRVADQLLPLDVHVCPVQRRDYFIAYLIYTPADIKPGKYQLRLTMEDLKGRKFGQSTVDFQITE